MGGFFGTVSQLDCVADLFYGTDYNSHLALAGAVCATYNPTTKSFTRSIHNLENAYFRSKFEPALSKFKGANAGIGIISDTDAQPLVINSHLGRFAIVTVAKITNIEQLTAELLEQNQHFAELSSGQTNQTELVALLLIQGKTFAEGIENVFRHIEGSCSMLLLTEEGIIAVRDDWGRTPVIIGKKDGAVRRDERKHLVPQPGLPNRARPRTGEAVYLRADSIEQLRAPQEHCQICSFLWVYYGFPTSTYEGRNVEEMRYDNGEMMAAEDDTDVDCVCGIPDSGVGMALGYAAGMRKPYQRAISKYTPTWPRSFTPPTQDLRALVAK